MTRAKAVGGWSNKSVVSEVYTDNAGVRKRWALPKQGFALDREQQEGTRTNEKVASLFAHLVRL